MTRIYTVPVRTSLLISETEPVVLHFKVLPGVDIGGTLSYVLQLDTSFLVCELELLHLH